MSEDKPRPALADLAAAIADETRLGLLDALRAAGPQGVTVNDLADRLELAQPRISTHLAVLRDAGLVTLRAAGRARIYRIEPGGRSLLAALEEVGGVAVAPRSVAATTVVARDLPLRQARTCYDHLAGLAGVDVLDHLVFNRWLVRSAAGGEDARPAYDLTSAGEGSLAALGIDVAGARARRRLFAGGCLDWTERRPHLAGSLGAAVLDALLRDGIVSRADGGRRLDLTGDLDAWLNRV